MRLKCLSELILSKMLEFPLEFSSFLQENIDYLSNLDDMIPRTIRVKECINLSELENDLKTHIRKIDWFPGFYQMEASVGLVQSMLYSKGFIYGMDVTSAVAVHALSISLNDHVLDLCCAPGAKTCYISDLQGTLGVGTVTGVDLSKQRLSVCRSLVKKYKLEKCRLFHADGTNFDVYAPSRVGASVLMVILFF